MSEISAISSVTAQTQVPANYNAVKIRIDKPKVIVPSNFNGDITDNGIYNAVNIAIDEPTVIRKDPIYNYPDTEQIVTYDKSGLAPVTIPVMPVAPTAYPSAFTPEEAYISTEKQAEAAVEMPQRQILQENTKVPEPNVTTVENEKAPTFNAKKEVEIIPSVDIKPDIDINDVIAKLASDDFDVQAVQLAKIAHTASNEPEKAPAYIVKDVFTNLINIINKNTDTLEGPTQEQMNIRKQIIMNELTRAKAQEEGKKPEDVKLPYEISEQDIALATKLSPLEMAERNKEYAIYTTAILCKTYVNEIEKQTGNVIAIVDLPGIADIVDTLHRSNNIEVKLAALQALDYIKRPEYTVDLKSIYEMASKDENPYIAKIATEALTNLN